MPILICPGKVSKALHAEKGQILLSSLALLPCAPTFAAGLLLILAHVWHLQLVREKVNGRRHLTL